MKNNIEKTTHLWLRRAFIRIVVYAVIYTFVLCGGVVLAMLMSSYITWQSQSFIYQILIRIRDSLIIILPLLLICGYLFIVYIELKKAYTYLSEIVNAIDKIDDHSSDFISLEHSELQEIGETLNKTKMNIQNNERAAKEAEQRKNDLVVYLAHDLKTPLTSIIGYLILLRDEQNISLDLQHHYIEVTLDKAERLEDLINEFFEITRFNLTQQVLEIARVDFVRLFEQLSYEFKPMLEEKNLICHLHMPKNLEVKCDIQKMQRVFDNLLRNAVNYSFENSDINITMEKQDNYVHIIFQNNGNTIPQEKLDHLFEQFYRLDSSRTSKTGGAGLGLSIAKEIVEQHGGTITAQSYDEKIIFEIFLPQD